MTYKKQIFNALDLIEKNEPSIAIVGDLILDEYMIGYPERISREAPVIILEHKESFHRLGGAANSAFNARSLGANVSLIGLIGQDHSATVLENICRENNITLNVAKSKKESTVLKTRILASNQAKALSSAGNSMTQQILRIDKLCNKQFDQEDIDTLNEIISNIKEEYILLSDYALGVLNPSTINTLHSLNKKLIIDPASNFTRFGGGMLITPNQPDTEKETKYMLNTTSLNTIREFYLELKKLMPQQENFLITRGAEGMILFEGDRVCCIPAFNRAEVFDVTGAGDTVAASMTVALASGLCLEDSMIIGNLAASIVVRKAGSSTTTISEMRTNLNTLPQWDSQRYKLSQ